MTTIFRENFRGRDVLQLLVRGPKSRPVLNQQMPGVSERGVDGILQTLIRANLAVRTNQKSMLGTVRAAVCFAITDAGRDFLRQGDAVFARAFGPAHAPVQAPTRRTHSGSGVIAPRPYARGLNWSREMRD